LLYLESEDLTARYRFTINSPGGSITAGLAIYDTIALHQTGHSHDLHGASGFDGGNTARSGHQREAVFSSSFEDRSFYQRSVEGIAGQATDVKIYCVKSFCERENRLSHYSGHLRDNLSKRPTMTSSATLF